jgi:cytochrome c-type biogenesis protein
LNISNKKDKGLVAKDGSGGLCGNGKTTTPYFFEEHMELLPVSFLAGVLTVLAPCILPLLPVIVGGSLLEKDRWRPLIITVSLAFSVVLFTLVLKSTTFFIEVPPQFWKLVSGGIVLVFGIITFFPHAWEKFQIALGFSSRSQSWLEHSHKSGGRLGLVLMGMALGPVFSSCSPTYALILATVLPQSFAVGLVNLFAYALGLAAVLLTVAFFGQKAVSKMCWAADPEGWLKKGLGILLMLVGVAVIFGWDKQLETFLIEKSYFDIGSIEWRFLQ